MTDTFPKHLIRTYRLVGHVPVSNEGTPEAMTSGIMERIETMRATGEDPWRVALTPLPNKHAVSTVFLGLDHNYFGGDPLLFETAIFGPNGLVDIFARTSTWEQAEEAHEKAAREAKTLHVKVVK